ncbi:MAG: hypothetical protein HQL93_11405 [Magnetococcales bacterium]|nr:hypothetical protein [Magnetococcales bacterium]
MSISLKRVLLVSGKAMQENLYREVIIKHQLERHGVEVRWIIPSRALNKASSLDDIENDPVFKREGAIRVDGEWQFRKQMRGSQMVVFSTWRSYLALTRMAQAEGRATINFCATSGIDHWTHGVERCLIRSRFTHRLLEHEAATMGLSLPPSDQIRIVGSIQYEYPKDLQPTSFRDRDHFCHHYGLDPRRPIAVLFPKGIQSFHKKVALWHPDWTQQQVDHYNQWFLDKYGEICHKARESACNLLIKMHPSAYVAYNCSSEFEKQYWHHYPWAKVVEAGHTQAMFDYADVGLGINTHASLDMGYFRKPFIYVDSDIKPPPNLPAFDNIKLGTLTPGPSSHWHSQPLIVNPWFRSWLGAFSRAEDLSALLADPKSLLPIEQADWEMFVEEYWGLGDNRASERIVAEILAFGEETLSSRSRKMSWSYWRGFFWDWVSRLQGQYTWHS